MLKDWHFTGYIVKISRYSRHSGPVKKAKDGPTDKKLSKKQKSIIAQAGLKTLKKAK